MLGLAPQIGPQQRRSGQEERTAERMKPGTACTAGRATIAAVESVAGIAAEQLVAAFAGQHYLHAPGGQARDEVKRHARRPGDRLVFVPDQPRQGLEEIFHAHNHFMMAGADGIGHLARIGEFTVSGSE